MWPVIPIIIPVIPVINRAYPVIVPMSIIPISIISIAMRVVSRTAHISSWRIIIMRMNKPGCRTAIIIVDVHVTMVLPIISSVISMIIPIIMIVIPRICL